MKGDKVEDDGVVNVNALFFDALPLMSINNPIPSPKGILTIKRMLESSSIEFIHVHNLRMISSSIWLFLSLLRKSEKHYSIILTDHGSRYSPFPRTALKGVDYYAAVSEVSGNILNSFSVKPTFVVPPIIPEIFFRKSELSTRDIDILVFGRVAPHKRQDLAINIVELLMKKGLTDLKMVIAGGIHDQNYFAELKRMVAKKGLQNHVFFMSSVDNHTHRQLLNRTGILLLLSWFIDMFGRRHEVPELSSAVILEAAATGVPVVASDIPAFKEVVENGRTGILVDPTHLEQTAKQIYDLLIDHKEIIKMGCEARIKCMENNSASPVINVFIKNLERIRAGQL